MPYLNKVLVIDDSEIDLHLAKIVLKKSDFAAQVDCRQTATDGLLFLKERKEIQGGMPDIIFLDIRMPGMDGFGFLEELNHGDTFAHLKLSVIMLTSSQDPKDMARAIHYKQVIQFMSKPLGFESLNKLKEKNILSNKD